MVDEKAILQILHETIKVDASGLAPAVVAHRIEGYEQAAKRILQALSPGSTGETEGWVLVPKEPTAKMLAAGQKAWLADPCRKSSTLYRAMLAAAPVPPSAMLSAAGERG